jgi:phosphoribosylaminoimidazolecarboxamide formyltransferase/IMP cyclohydrolase
VDRALAEALTANPKADVLIASGFDEDARELLTRKRKAMRVLEASAPGPERFGLRRIDGGFLVQTPEEVAVDRSAWSVVTKRAPTEAEWADLTMAWVVCAAVASNAIVLVKDGRAVGIGAGQQSRVDAAEIAARKAAGRAAGGACASDAFYPFRDGLDAAAAAGATAVIQPGGSVRDPEVVAAADEHGLAMVFTGRRHFRH